jgi:uncharacterized protein (DUF58 family)
VSTWIRRTYDAIGVTQAPPGKHLAALQEPYIGKVLLCIDVSGSMYNRIHHAVAGARTFVAEAVEAHYEVGLVLWHHGVAGFVPLSRDPAKMLKALAGATISGGNNITPTLELGIEQLGRRTGDRVMAIFGDGDIGAVAPAQKVARRAAGLGIRIIVRGLGDHAAAQLRLIATDPGDEKETVISSAADIGAGVASMVTKLVGGISSRP